MRIRTALVLLSAALGLNVLACGSDVFDTAISDGGACCEDAGSDVVDGAAVSDTGCQSCSDASEAAADSGIDAIDSSTPVDAGMDSSEADSSADSGASADAGMDGGVDANSGADDGGTDSGTNVGNPCTFETFSCDTNGKTPLSCPIDKWVINGVDCNFGCDASDGGTGECLRSNPLGYTVSALPDGLPTITENKAGSKTFARISGGGVSSDQDQAQFFCTDPDVFGSETGWGVATYADLQTLMAQDATYAGAVSECQNSDFDMTTVGPLVGAGALTGTFSPCTDNIGNPGVVVVDWVDGFLECQTHVSPSGSQFAYVCVKSNP